MDHIDNHLTETANVLAKIPRKDLELIADNLMDARDNGGTVYLFGNGGSHSTADHFQNDLLKACCVPAICLSSFVSTLLAFMNDDGADKVFINMLKKLDLQPSDIVIAFSTSGNSPNIVEALKFAKLKCTTILLTGNVGGEAISIAHMAIRTDSANIRVQESVHLTVCHAITEYILCDGA